MLAVNRTDSVIGRTKILTVSITTKNGLRGAGAPIGKSPATTEDGAKNTAEIIKESHNGSPIDNDTAKCLVGLKT